MIEAHKASTIIYEVLRMSRAAMTHLPINRIHLAKNGQGHPCYTSGDVPTSCPAEFFQSLYHGKVDD